MNWHIPCRLLKSNKAVSGPGEILDFKKGELGGDLDTRIDYTTKLENSEVMADDYFD